MVRKHQKKKFDLERQTTLINREICSSFVFAISMAFILASILTPSKLAMSISLIAGLYLLLLVNIDIIINHFKDKKEGWK